MSDCASTGEGPDSHQVSSDDGRESCETNVRDKGGDVGGPENDFPAPDVSGHSGRAHPLHTSNTEQVTSQQRFAKSNETNEAASDIAVAGDPPSPRESFAGNRLENGNEKTIRTNYASGVVTEQFPQSIVATVELLINAAALVKTCTNPGAPRDFLLKTAASVLQQAAQGIEAVQSSEPAQNGDLSVCAGQPPLSPAEPPFQTQSLMGSLTDQLKIQSGGNYSDGVFDIRTTGNPGNNGDSKRVTFADEEEDEEEEEEEGEYYDDEGEKYGDGNEEDRSFDDQYESEYSEEDDGDDTEELFDGRFNVSADREPGALHISEREDGPSRTKKVVDHRLDECPIVVMLEDDMDRDNRYAITVYYPQLPEGNRNDGNRNGRTNLPVSGELRATSRPEHPEQPGPSEHPEQPRQSEHPEQPEQSEQPASARQQTRNPAVAIQIGSPILLGFLSDVFKMILPQPCLLYPPYKPIIHHWDTLTSRLEQLKESHNASLAALNAEEASRQKDSGAPIHGEDDAQPSGEGSGLRSSGESNVADDGASDASDGTLYDPSEAMRTSILVIQQTIIHIQTLLDLIRMEAPAAVEVREKLLSGTLRSIPFEELWQLYNVGDVLIYRHNGRELACQVFSVTGGRRGNLSLSTAPNEAVFAGYEGIGRGGDAGELGATSTSPEARDAIPQYPNTLVRCSPSAYQGFRPGRHDRGIEEQDETYTPFIIDCFFMDFDGTYIGPCHLPLDIPHYAGEREISSLDIYPVAFHDPEDDIMARLSARGRRFMNCAGHKTYDGWSLSGHADLQGQMYVDFETGYRQIGWPANRAQFGRLIRHVVPGPAMPMLDAHKRVLSDEKFNAVLSDQFIQGRKRELWKFVKPDGNVVPEESYALMSYAVLGYAFQQRRWYYLDIDYVGDIDTSDAARGSGWEDLVIPPAYREMLVALVESHASGTVKRSAPHKKPALSTQMDLVRGKGHGLIILLHGPPGSGKTSTAETIAAYTKRPLYSITCGDIGSTAQEIEKNLQKHFELAHQWGCVLLLDEADVFLTKRNWHDINRNSLVSIWLRILEYYSGILFITTNRIGVIDEAFKSRIHVCLRYPSLDEVSTRLVWEKLLNRIERDNATQAVKIVFDRDELLSFADRHYRRSASTNTTWNGRQIRNAFQTAIALGQYERLRKLRRKEWSEEDAEKSGKKKYMEVRLCKENFAKIAGTAADFENYLTSVRGSDGTAARNESVRDDEYQGRSGTRPVKRYSTLPVVKPTWGQPQVREIGAGSSMGGPRSMGMATEKDSAYQDNEDGPEEQGSDSDGESNSDW